MALGLGLQVGLDWVELGCGGLGQSGVGVGWVRVGLISDTVMW